MKKYSCPFCGDSHYRDNLISHLDRKHSEELDPKMSSSHLVFNIVNKRDHGVCCVCGKETKWNENANKYDKLCGNPKCREQMRENFKKNMIRVYKKTTLLNDDEHQQKMLANRKISGTYTFTDGGKRTYTGNYEKKALEFMDKVLRISSKDVETPGPTLEYENEGKKRKWITDIFYIPYNLIIEVKDGGSNPNTREMEVYRQKQVDKETMITNLGTFNYLRLTDNNFLQLMEVFTELKQQFLDDSEENRKAVIKINEHTPLGAIGGVVGSAKPVAIKYSYEGKDDEVEGFALCDDIVNDNILVKENGVYQKVSYEEFLKDRKFSMYAINNVGNYKKILESVNDKDNVLPLHNPPKNLDMIFINPSTMKTVTTALSLPLIYVIARMMSPLMATIYSSLMALRTAIDGFFLYNSTYDIYYIDSVGKRKNVSHGHSLKDFYIFGTPVIAINSGKVVSCRKNNSDIDKYTAQYGNYVIIQHDTWTYSLYAHLAEGSVNVSEGETVNKGDVIGNVGASGETEEPKLHFQLNVINPVAFMNLKINIPSIVYKKPTFRPFMISNVDKSFADVIVKTITNGNPRFNIHNYISAEKEYHKATELSEICLVKNITSVREDTNVYEDLTDSKMLSIDSIDFNNDFEKIELKEADTSGVRFSLIEEYNRLNGSVNQLTSIEETYLPVLDKQVLSEFNAEMFEKFAEFDLYEDLNGFFAYNTVEKKRTKSYTNFNDLLNEVKQL